ncbi:MAG: hypothetical protein M0D57_08565 [Sphingobacteriales bacterium JAD_PAG50586_3]|nr:MAG: hypothetical protein M0D57_08565 [Sphingobacteriales bacterium JAD_PAG50586_3]
MNGVNGGVEFGFSGDTHLGVDISFIVSNAKMGRWKPEDGYSPYHNLKYTNSEDYAGYGTTGEPVYMKSVGDMAPNDQTFFNKFGDAEAVYLPLSNSGHYYSVASVLKNSSGSFAKQISSSIKRTGRDKRNQVISYLTAAEAQHLALDKSLKHYDALRNNSGVFTLENSAIKPMPQVLERGGSSTMIHEYKKPHHLSEVVVTNTDGSRYVYGIAAYNTEQTEYTFNVDPNGGNDVTGGLVDFTPTDITNNDNGRDHYSSKTKTPAYAHSYLLTTVLSADYVDLTGDGPTEDDFGDYTKINYVRVHDDFGWKTPINSGKANYSKGLRSDSKDDKGNMVCGKKELWYVCTIESKTQIAKFTLKPREDGLGANISNYTIDYNKQLVYIDKIELFSKSDLEKIRVQQHL